MRQENRIKHTIEQIEEETKDLLGCHFDLSSFKDGQSRIHIILKRILKHKKTLFNFLADQMRNTEKEMKQFKNLEDKLLTHMQFYREQLLGFENTKKEILRYREEIKNLRKKLGKGIK